MLLMFLLKPGNNGWNYLLEMRCSNDASVTKLLFHSHTLLHLILLLFHLHHFEAQLLCEREIREASARRVEFYALFNQRGRCSSQDCREARPLRLSRCTKQFHESSALRAEFYALYNQQGRCSSQDCREAWGRYQAAKLEVSTCLSLWMPPFRLGRW